MMKKLNKKSPFKNTEPLKKKKYKVYLEGVYKMKGFQPVRYTDSKGNRKTRFYKSKKSANARLNLERSRGWKGYIK